MKIMKSMNSIKENNLTLKPVSILPVSFHEKIT